MNKPRLEFGKPIPEELLREISLHYQSRGPSCKIRKSYAKRDRMNPCIRIYGAGPEGQTCKGCVHLFARGGNKVFHKCALRGQPTSGPATDHYVTWPACARFEKAEK